MRTRPKKPASGSRSVEKSTFTQKKSRSGRAAYATACGSTESASRNVEYVGAEAPTP